jgi:hypothetical protein
LCARERAWYPQSRLIETDGRGTRPIVEYDVLVLGREHDDFALTIVVKIEDRRGCGWRRPGHDPNLEWGAAEQQLSKLCRATDPVRGRADRADMRRNYLAAVLLHVGEFRSPLSEKPRVRKRGLYQRTEAPQ